MEFINTPSNELINNKEEVIKHLTKMAYALTSESLAEAAEVFEQSDIWKKSIKLRLWVQDKWINVSRVKSLFSLTFIFTKSCLLWPEKGQFCQ